MPDDFKFRALTGEDWKDIQSTSLTYKDGLTLKERENDGPYISPFLNSGISECQWHRIKIKADIPDNATITVSFSTSDHEGSENDEHENWYDGCVFKKNVRDALIQVPSGQYIRLKIELHRDGEKSPVLKQVKVYYPRLSYLRYLPEVFQENSESKEFLERYLSIFESAFYDSEECISHIPLYIDPKAAPEEFYRWLADWVSLDLYELLTDNEKREFILKAVEFYKQKGTVSGLASLVSFLTGKKCCIKEYKNNVFRSYQMKHDSVFDIEPEEKVEPEKMMDILRCEDNIDIIVNRNDDNKSDCTKFYYRTSRTVDKKVPGLLANRGKYCDEIHYVTGIGKSGTKRKINYFSNSIGIFVFFHFNDELEINEDQLRKIIDSFLPVFVTVDVTFVESPVKESYVLNLVDEKFFDKVDAPAEEKIVNVTGDYIDQVVGWKRFYTYYDHGTDEPPYGCTYSDAKPECKQFRTVHGAVGFTFNI